MKYYSEDNAQEFADDLIATFSCKITEKQAKLLIGYMEGSGYAFGIKDRALYKVDINEESGEIWPCTITEAIQTILEWQDDFSQTAGEVKMEDFTLEDMVDEDSFTHWRGGIFGSWAEREDTRTRLQQLKFDEQYLLEIIGGTSTIHAEQKHTLSQEPQQGPSISY